MSKKLTPREKSIKTILEHKRFCKGKFFTKSLCCPIGYAMKVNNLSESIFYSGITQTKFTKLIGLTTNERFKIMKLTDSSRYHEMKEYVRSLKK